MAKSKRKSMGKMILSIITMIIGVLTFLPLVLNDWNGVSKAGSVSEVAEAGKFFDDYSAAESLFKLGDSTLVTAMSTITGIAVIVGLCAAALYIVFAIINMCGKGNKLCTTLCKVASIIMLAAGAVALIAGLVFCIPTATVLGTSHSFTFGVGAYLAVALPVVAGVFGIASTK